ncbi:MAG TPA: N-6 DNA methylase [Vicinamibacterales bacterium]|nr:N-6 DNA methylase [Vicinamibacterales bacterium]
MALFPSLRNRHGFFSEYWLGTVFGRATGRQRTLVTREVETAWRTFVRVYERAEGRAETAADVRERFARPLLGQVFGYHLGVPAGTGLDARIVPLYASAEAEAAGRPPLLLAYVGDWNEDLDAGKPAPTRALADRLARAAGELHYGLLITGERLRLIRRAGEGPRGACLELALAECLEAEDRESFAAALRLFSRATFERSADGSVPIEAIERESREHAERVSDELKRAVFQSAEALVEALLASHGNGDRSVEPSRLLEFRDAALTCLYRILFILYAEARDPALLAHPIYRESYSLDQLVRDLLRGRETPADNRAGLWEHLRALFAIHDAGLPGLDGQAPIPARGGDLFSPQTPAGQILEAARLSDRVVARILFDLTTTPPRRGVGREQVSFRELDIEQLGAVYEGLLEYEPKVARTVTLEVSVQGRTFALTPPELVRLATARRLVLSGDPALVAGTEAEVLHPDAAEGEEASDDERDDDAEEREADEPERDEEEAGIQKGAHARLVRRLDPGRFHFVPGPARKGSGSFYTPLPLVRDLVRHALGPLVDGKGPAEIEALRVLDPACGSAHFLVEAMRFLARALHRAYVDACAGKAPPHFRGQWDPHWQAPDEEARAAGSEARAWCKRRVVERCLYGVDLNPTAVELARVALWIESLAGDRPLTYFAHHLRCGNSLLGTWLARLGAPPLPGLGPERRLFPHAAAERIRRAAELRRLIDLAADMGAVEPESLEELRFKEERQREAEATLADARLLFDLRSASAFVTELWKDWQTLASLLGEGGRLEAYARSRPWWDRFDEVRRRERFFHWELEFPEVFLAERPGFDAVLGNPPWDKIKPDRKEFYGRSDVLIRAYVGGELDRRIGELEAADPALRPGFAAYEARVKTLAACLRKGGDYRYETWEVDGKRTGGDPDTFKFFLERAWQLAREGGRVGMVVPSAIYNNEGCTGLRHLLLEQAEVERFYAFENRKKIFPIDSRYKFANLVFRKGAPAGDGFQAAFMRHDLAELDDDRPKPFMVVVRRRELERLSPGTLAFLEYRSPRDREILLKMYGYDAEGNPVNPRPLLGDQGPGTWNARFYREFDMTNDRDLWTDPRTGKLWNPRQILGPIPGTTSEPPYYDPRAWPEIRARMAEHGFWPLYEGKHIEQFLVDIRPIERWVSLEAAERKYGNPPDQGPKLVFRDIARNTDERTCIAAVLPEGSCANHKLPIVTCEAAFKAPLLCVLNSLPFDFSLRLRSASTSLTFTIMSQCVVPNPERLSSTLVLNATSLVLIGRVKHVSELTDYWDVIWSVNRAVAEAYGLGPDDFEHILSTFPVFARKRPAFHAYLLERLAEWKEEVGGGRGAVRYTLRPSDASLRVAEGPNPGDRHR